MSLAFRLSVFIPLIYLLNAGALVFAEDANFDLFVLIVTFISATMEVAALGILICKCYDIPVLQGIEAAMLSHFVIYTADDVVSQAAATYSPLFDRMHFYTFITIVLPKLWAFFVAFLAAYVLRRSGFYRHFAALFYNKLKTALIMTVSYTLMFVWTVIDWFYPNAEPNALYAIFFFSLITVVLLWVQFMAMYTAGQEKIHIQEETIAQQQAQEGDLDGIQEFMKKTSGYFDEKLGNEIKQMDGLNNIKLYPVRSLLTAKLAAMRQKHIQSALEVLHPVQERQMMETADILRGLGILIDNAMEAVPGKNGEIRLVMLQEEKELYIAVVNNYDVAPDLSALSEKGYTTKGSGRGT